MRAEDAGRKSAGYRHIVTAATGAGGGRRRSATAATRSRTAQGAPEAHRGSGRGSGTAQRGPARRGASTSQRATTARTARAAQRAPQPAPARRVPTRLTPRLWALGSIVLVIVVVMVFVAVNLTSTPPASGKTAPVDRPTPPAVVAAVTGIPVREMDAVGVPASVTVPTADATEPPLVIGGHPGAIYIGGEFCPYCAAERWAIVVAFSKFGTFTGLDDTTSSPWDGTPYATVSFIHAHYTSSLVTFDPVEYMGNDTHGLDTRKVIATLTPIESSAWATYSEKYSGGSEGFPFLDIGNRLLAIGPSYDPTVLAGLTQAQIARELSDPASPVTRAIVGSADYLTAGICSLTDLRPAPVCSAAAVTAAARVLGLR